MTRRDLVLLFVVAAIAIVTLTLPMTVALPLLLPRHSGVSATAVTGTIWSGRLSAATIAGLSVGDTDVALAAVPLLAGTARIHFESATLAGVARITPDTIGVADLTGNLNLGAKLAPLPVASIALDHVAVVFRQGKCTAASGGVRAVVAGQIGGLALPNGLSGIVSCDGDAVLVQLVGQSGMERIDMRLTAAGKWQAMIVLRRNDPALAAKLREQGFFREGGAMALRVAGAL